MWWFMPSHSEQRVKDAKQHAKELKKKARQAVQRKKRMLTKWSLIAFCVSVLSFFIYSLVRIRLSPTMAVSNIKDATRFHPLLLPPAVNVSDLAVNATHTNGSFVTVESKQSTQQHQQQQKEKQQQLQQKDTVTSRTVNTGDTDSMQQPIPNEVTSKSVQAPSAPLSPLSAHMDDTHDRNKAATPVTGFERSAVTSPLHGSVDTTQKQKEKEKQPASIQLDEAKGIDREGAFNWGSTAEQKGEAMLPEANAARTEHGPMTMDNGTDTALTTEQRTGPQVPEAAATDRKVAVDDFTVAMQIANDTTTTALTTGAEQRDVVTIPAAQEQVIGPVPQPVATAKENGATTRVENELAQREDSNTDASGSAKAGGQDVGARNTGDSTMTELQTGVGPVREGQGERSVNIAPVAQAEARAPVTGFVPTQAKVAGTAPAPVTEAGLAPVTEVAQAQVVEAAPAQAVEAAPAQLVEAVPAPVTGVVPAPVTVVSPGPVVEAAPVTSVDGPTAPSTVLSPAPVVVAPVPAAAEPVSLATGPTASAERIVPVSASEAVPATGGISGVHDVKERTQEAVKTGMGTRSGSGSGSGSAMGTSSAGSVAANVGGVTAERLTQERKAGTDSTIIPTRTIGKAAAGVSSVKEGGAASAMSRQAPTSPVQVPTGAGAGAASGGATEEDDEESGEGSGKGIATALDDVTDEEEGGTRLKLKGDELGTDGSN